MTLKIDCYLSPECATEQALKNNIALALDAENMQAELSINRLDDDQAIALGVTGSPSVFINGRELQPLGIASFT